MLSIQVDGTAAGLRFRGRVAVVLDSGAGLDQELYRTKGHEDRSTVPHGWQEPGELASKCLTGVSVMGSSVGVGRVRPGLSMGFDAACVIGRAIHEYIEAVIAVPGVPCAG